MRISDWSSDVCSSDLDLGEIASVQDGCDQQAAEIADAQQAPVAEDRNGHQRNRHFRHQVARRFAGDQRRAQHQAEAKARERSEEHTSELQSLMRISYAVFGLKKKKNKYNNKKNQ